MSPDVIKVVAEVAMMVATAFTPAVLVKFKRLLITTPEDGLGSIETTPLPV